MNDLWQLLLHAHADITLTVAAVLAAGATVHILLKKREVASAVGWIGLVWLAPILGVIMYAMFGVNRVGRRARKLRPSSGGSDNPFARTSPHAGEMKALGRGIGQITARPLLPATVVQAYQDGDEAYPPMLAAIAAAKTSVAMSSYIFRNDQWGGRFIEALAAAKARGAQVRVLIDGIGGGWLFSPAYYRLRRAGVATERFMHSWLPWRMPFLNLRSHKKVLVVDGAIGFTGGMNIADENVMATHPKEPVKDLHFRIEGPVVSQLASAFEEDWVFATEDDAAEIPDPRDDGQSGGIGARVIDSGPDEDLEKVEFAVLQAVSCARKSIAVMTPYFLPDERLITALTLAAMRGVSVQLIVPEKSDHIVVDWATRSNIGPLLTGGARIWRSPPPFHHSKMMIVDTEWCLIGSCNWDIRSFRLNFELCMEIYDTGIAKTLEGLMDNARGRELLQTELDARSLPVRLRDAAARLMLPYL